MENKNDFTPEEIAVIEREFSELKDIYLHSSHRKKIDKIEDAFRFAHKAHWGVRRRSGEPYIMHPLAVARIVADEIGLGSTSISCSLLHDVVEDTEYTVEDIDSLFGPKIASIVGGLTKISGGVFGDKASKQAENFRKLLLTMSEDIRVILIKIADRLHNMRTLGAMPERKQQKVIGETQYIYAPLANRLGLYSIKTELEDLSFKYQQPEQYDEIVRKLNETQEERECFFKNFSQPLSEKLRSIGFDVEIVNRTKSIFSIWHKMQTQNIPFEEVYDILALRIVFDEECKKDEKSCCWEIYNALTNVYKPHPQRTRDWLSLPKANGYEALHVTLMGNEGQWIEVQIRSRRMNEIAEKGIAAHWRYKTTEQIDSELDKWIETIKELLENPNPEAVDFMDTFQLTLFASDIFVFTPKGDFKTLPKGATALDFAFSIHSDIGLHCIGAKVNHKLEPLSYILNSGDQVEVLTAKKQKPEADWITFVKTARAKNEIESHLRKDKTYIKKGEELLSAELEKINRTLSDENIGIILRHFNEHRRDELYYKIGIGKYKPDDLEKILKEKEKEKEKDQFRWVKSWIPQFGKLSGNKAPAQTGKKQSSQKINKKEVLKITDENVKDNYLIPDCCNPIPGDDIIAFVEMDDKIIVHKTQCPVAMRLKANYGERIVSADWKMQKKLLFSATIEVKGIDRISILSDTINVISSNHVNINKINLETKDGIFKGQITLYVHDVDDVNHIVADMQKIAGIKTVNRVS